MTVQDDDTDSTGAWFFSSFLVFIDKYKYMYNVYWCFLAFCACYIICVYIYLKKSKVSNRTHIQIILQELMVAINVSKFFFYFNENQN